MARKKLQAPDNVGDVPAWFMTYSDVITLLMTFFILLLTFATTEPDRFERIQKTLFVGANGTGVAGHHINGPENESFFQRVRPRAARMALDGSEMPPYQDWPSAKSVGKGVKSLDEKSAEQNVLSTHEFEVPVKSIISDTNTLTSKGAHVASMLASQLRKLPVSLTVQCSDRDLFEKATAFVIYLYHTEKIRPGQVGVSIVEGVTSARFRFSVERIEG